MLHLIQLERFIFLCDRNLYAILISDGRKLEAWGHSGRNGPSFQAPRIGPLNWPLVNAPYFWRNGPCFWRNGPCFQWRNGEMAPWPLGSRQGRQAKPLFVNVIGGEEEETPPGCKFLSNNTFSCAS